MMNIQEYFALKLAGYQMDAGIGALDMPCDSECGRDCMKAIDAASLLLDHLLAANGDNSSALKWAIIESANRIVSIYICG
jgi:hypothetical protein